MSMRKENTSAGKSRTQQFEQAVADMIADRILPEDFEIKEIGEYDAWGMCEDFAVMWVHTGQAYACRQDSQTLQNYLYWNEENQCFEKKEGQEFLPEPKYNICYE